MPVSRRQVLSGAAATVAAAIPPRRARAAETVIRIGVLTDLSGQYRDNSGPTSVLAAHQAVEDFKPESHGFKVEVLAADHQQKPDIASGVARRWFDVDGVDAVADMNNSAVALAVRTIAIEKDKAQLITGGASAEFTGKYCSANLVHFTPDTWFFAHGTGNAVMKQGDRTWFILVPDYAFGHATQSELTSLVTEGGGKVLGAVRYPFPGTTDFSSFLLSAQGSGAKVLGLGATGGDMESCVKQAHEFGLPQSGMKIAALYGFITEIHAMGLKIAEGLLVSNTFYWDLNERTRAFTQRFLPKTPNNYPSSLHASCYAGVTHYLKAVASLGPAAARKSGRAAIAKMKATPTDDDCFGKQHIREDGRFMTPGFLFEVKKPSQSKQPWDVFNVLATTPAAEAFHPLWKSCSLVKS